MERSVFKARRVANPTMSGWLPDHAVLTEGERIRAVVPQREQEHLEVTRDMRARGARFIIGLDMGMAHARFDASAASARAFVKWFG